MVKNVKVSPFQLLKLLEASFKQEPVLIQEFPSEKVSKCQTFASKPGAFPQEPSVAF